MLKRILLLSALLFVVLLGQAQLVLNEVSQGPSSASKEYFEFVVVGTRTCTDSTADLRGWIIDDNNGWIAAGSGQGIAAGCIRFANVASWSAVPYGSIIVVYNEKDKSTAITLPDDLTDANHDYVYILPASANVLERNFVDPSVATGAAYPTTGFGQGVPSDSHWGTVALANGGDGILTVKPTNLSSAYFSFGYAIGSAATATVWVADMPSGKNWYLSNANYNQAASWTQGNVGVDETPGAPNSAANATWINGMRVQVTTLPVAAITPANPGLCLNLTGSTPAGYSRALSSATPGGTWSSSNPLVATVNASGVVTSVSVGTATITYTVTNGTCSGTATTTVTVFTDNSLTVTGGPTVCVGGTTTMSSGAASGGTWTSTNPAVATIDPVTGVVTGLTTGTTTIYYSMVGPFVSCGLTGSAPITVVTGGANAGTVTGGPSGCTGATTSFTSSGAAGGTWTSSNPAVASINPVTGVATGVSAGSTNIIYTVGSGACAASASATFSVLQSPPLTPTTGPNAVCVGAQVVLTNAAINGSGTWAATPAGIVILQPSLAAGGPSTVTVTGVAPGVVNISLTLLTNNGCTTVVPFTFTVNALPVVPPITGAPYVCLSQTTVLNATPAGGTWSSANTAIATVSNTGLVTGLAAGFVDISYTVSNGTCSNSATKQMTVYAPPSAGTITGNMALCTGNTSTLSNPSATGAAGQWISSAPGVATISNSGLVTAISAGSTTITFTAISAQGCSASTTATVTVSAPPAVAAITGANTVCLGASTTFANSTPGGVWSSASTAIATSSNAGVITGVSVGTANISYTVTVNGCAASVLKSISVNPLPVVAPITGNLAYCVGASGTLSDPTGGVFTWSSSNAAVAGISGAGVVSALRPGSSIISYTVVNADGCTAAATATVVVDTLDLRVSATPNPVSAGQNVVLTASGNIPFTVLSWTPAFPNNTATTQSFAAAQSGTYIVSGRSPSGCTDTGRVDLVVIPVSNDLFVPNFFTPNADGRNDVLYIYGSTIAALDFRIFNQWGEAVFCSNDKGRGWDGTASGKMQPVGVYMYVARVTLLNGDQKTLKGSINLIR